MAYSVFPVYFVPTGSDAATRRSRHIWVTSGESAADATQAAGDRDKTAAAVGLYGSGTLAAATEAADAPLLAGPGQAWYNVTTKKLQLTPVTGQLVEAATKAFGVFGLIRQWLDTDGDGYPQADTIIARELLWRWRQGFYIVLTRDAYSVPQKIAFCAATPLGPSDVTSEQDFFDKLDAYKGRLGNNKKRDWTSNIVGNPIVTVDPRTGTRIEFDEVILVSGPRGGTVDGKTVTGLNLRDAEVPKTVRLARPDWIAERLA